MKTVTVKIIVGIIDALGRRMCLKETDGPVLWNGQNMEAQFPLSPVFGELTLVLED